ncbi:MAG: ABC transporter ATP-binding protein/permease [Candidatus Bathyarchaeota archaeon]|nr:ABC transporter ATP-binding protein/permease [Candidatus Bathyarchaeota archaeon]
MSVIGKLSRYIFRSWHWFAVSVAATLVSTYVNVNIPQLMGVAVEDILEIGNFELLKLLVIQIIALTIVQGIASLVMRYASGYLSYKVIFEVRNDTFKSIQRQSFGFFDRMKTGQLMSRTTTDVNRIREFVGWQLRMLVEFIFLFSGIIMTMIVISPTLTAISFSMFSILFVSYAVYGKKIRPVVHTAREHFGNLTSVLWENITGMRVIRSFAREDYEEQKFGKPNQDYYGKRLEVVKIRAIFRQLNPLVVGLAMAGLYWFGGLQILDGNMSVPLLFVFAIYMQRLTGPISRLGLIWSGYQRMAAAAERVFEIIDAVPEVRDKTDAISLPPIKGHVVLENVSFGYDKRRLILKDVNLEANLGETIALLGPTGSGKSTIIRLLPRFYDPSSGRILVDGYDIKDVKSKELRKRMGIVSQETFLFNRTIKENIAYGKPDATIDEITKVAKIAKAHGFILSFPKGYDTIVGERGVTLSGGQQQRVAIARALLMDPKILILDDSTSSVDVDTEYEIQQALNALFKNRTTFVVTQRISTIRNADKIVVLDNGRIVEEGDHESLIAQRGAYYRIYQTLYEAQKEAFKSETSGESEKTEKESIADKKEGGA